MGSHAFQQEIEVALDQYRTIYRPLVTVIKQGPLVDSLPERAVADLYAYIDCITESSAGDAITVLK